MFAVEIFDWLIDNHIDDNFKPNIFSLFTLGTEISVLAGFDIIHSRNSLSFDLFRMIVFDAKLFELFLDFLGFFLLEGDLHSHVSSGNFEFALEQFDALKSLFFSGLINLHPKVYFFQCLFYSFMSEPPLSHWVHALLNNDVHNFSQQSSLLGISFFVCHLQLA